MNLFFNWWIDSQLITNSPKCSCKYRDGSLGWCAGMDYKLSNARILGFLSHIIVGLSWKKKNLKDQAKISKSRL